MGNETSHIQSIPSPYGSHRPVAKASQPRLKHKLSCIAAWSSQESLQSSVSTSFPTEHGLSKKRAAIIQHSLVKPEEQAFDAAPDLKDAFNGFMEQFPEYRKTWMLDSLRRSDYTRLTHNGEVYVDYMGGW